MGMRVLVDTDTLLEFILNRSKFVDGVEYLSEMYDSDSSIQMYVSDCGVRKIADLIKPLKGKKITAELVAAIKRKSKIVRVTKVVAEQAQSSPIADYESAVEIYLAIEHDIGAIVTHKPENFTTSKINTIEPSKFSTYHTLENAYSKETGELSAVINISPVIFEIKSEEIKDLKALPLFWGKRGKIDPTQRPRSTD